jgi:arsenate reductase-like glutaredoxin family protein
LDESQKEGVDQHKAIALMVEKPTLIKRPLLDTGKNILLGFKIDAYQQVL